MMRYALYSYVPRRFARKASFDQKVTNQMILGFKDGYNVYSRWAAREMARALRMMDLSEVVIACVPASTRYSNSRRWHRFSEMLCELTGATNGFDRIQVRGSRSRVHMSGDNELATNIKRCIDIDAAFFKGRKVLVIDDIVTSGQSANAFAAALEAAGATVMMQLFLAKTRKIKA